MKKPLRTAIVLQGGGALGAYECGVLKALYEARGGPANFQPAVITGLSIGAVNAALLAGAKGDPIETLERVWREDFALLAPLPSPLQPFVTMIPQHMQQQLSALGNVGMYRMRPEYYMMPLIAPLVTTSMCDTSPLRATLEREIDLDKLNGVASRTHVAVTATDIKTGELKHFGNLASQKCGVEHDNEGPMTIDHILASGSLPPGFPMTRLNGDYYWDGGLISNTPLSEAINCLERCAADGEEVDREIIFVELFPQAGKLPTSISEVMARVMNMVFASKYKIDKALFDKINSYITLAEHVQALLDVIDERPGLREQIDQALHELDERVSIEGLRTLPSMIELLDKKHINALTCVCFRADPVLANGGDFSQASINARIEAGIADALAQKIGEPHFLAQKIIERRLAMA